MSSYRSKLEQTASTLLKENNIAFSYEPYKVLLVPSFKFDSLERVGKQFKAVSTVRQMTYTPDFVGSFWVMETKGKQTADFVLKWKLFKQLLASFDVYPPLFLPTNKKEIVESITHILDLKESAELKTLQTKLKTFFNDTTSNRISATATTD